MPTAAISLNDLQIAQDTEDKAKVDVETTAEHLRLLGNDPDHPSGIVDIVAPVSGVITDQQVTNAAGVQALGSNPFTISDLSYVWVVCDVYENDLPNVRLGDSADIRLNAYPDQVIQGNDQQYRRDSRSQYSHRQGAHRGAQSRDHARWACL